MSPIMRRRRGLISAIGNSCLMRWSSNQPSQTGDPGVSRSLPRSGFVQSADNIFVERLWRSLKYEEVYIHAYASVAEAKTGIGAWLDFYNAEREHQSLDIARRGK